VTGRTGPRSSAVVIGAREPVTEALAQRLGAAVVTGAVGEQESGRSESIDVTRWIYVAAARGSGGLPDLDDARAVFGAARRRGIRHLTVLSSARVHEPSHHHPGMVREERTAALRFGNRVAAGWRELEDRARQATDAYPGLRLAVLRPVTVPEAASAGDPVGRLLTGRSRRWRVALPLPGHDPSVQLLSLEDLCEAVARVTEAEPTGTFHVAPERPVPLRRALRLAGRWSVPFPRKLQGLWHSHDDLAYLRYSWTVSGERLAEELGFVPRKSSAEVARDLTGRPGEAGAPPEKSEKSSAKVDLPDFDEWGLDPGYIAAFERTLFRFLHDVYWRIELAGLGHLPRSGPAVLVGIHRGFQPWDGVMALVAVRRATGRTPRFLLHPALAKLPFLADYMTKLGGIHACRENADRILDRGDLLGIFPEGIRGAFSYYREAYELKAFGRDELVRMALRNRAPVVPFVTVGSAEIYPILAKLDWRAWKRWTEWPCFPITPTMGLVPLPSKWHTLFLPPIRLEERYGPEVAGDLPTVQALSREIQGTMKAALDDLRTRRRSIFWGSIFE